LVKNVAHPFDPFGLSSVKKNSTGISTGKVSIMNKLLSEVDEFSKFNIIIMII